MTQRPGNTQALFAARVCLGALGAVRGGITVAVLAAGCSGARQRKQQSCCRPPFG